MEWKSTWRDEYFKWLCGYANVKGGHLFIGVNDDGYVIGCKNYRKLLEDLPNRIISKIGIVPNIRFHSARKMGVNIRYGTDGTIESENLIPENIRMKEKNLYAAGKFVPVNERQKKKLEVWEKEEPITVNEDGSLDYLEIIIEPYPHMVSYEGKVYKRSGSTMQELNGIALEKFVLERSGKTWDSVVIPGVKISDLSKESIALYKEKSIRRGRRTKDQLNVPDEVLLRDLKAIDEEGRLTRAALLFFHPKPETFVTGAYIKIGFFGAPGEYGENKYNDVIYQDEIRGPFVKQIDAALELLYTKYLKAMISYSGLQRIETFMWPREAFREILLNAIDNKLYQSGNPIQIKVYDDCISVFNEGKWPVKKLPVNDIYKRHASYPENPDLAALFYASGEIEAWGSGFLKIKEECEKAGAPLPVIEIGEGDTPDKGVIVNCNASDKYMRLLQGVGRRENVIHDSGGKSEDSKNDERNFIMKDQEEKESIERMLLIISKDLSNREKKKLLPIAEYLKEHDTITSKIVAELTGKTISTAQRYINRLIDLDVLRKEGTTNGLLYKRI